MSTFPRPSARAIRVPYGCSDVSHQDGISRRSAQDVVWATVICAAVVAGLVVRLILLQRYYLIPDADQSVLGLMARHILLGERPLFYWGQSYTGSGEAYVTAALFGLFGQSNLLLHLTPLAASTAFTATTCAITWRLYGGQVAALTSVLLAVGPALLVDWSLWAGSGYVEAMAAGSAAILLVLPSQGNDASLGRVLLAFFLLGLAVWIQPTGAYYLVAVIAALAGSAGRPQLRVRVVVAVIAAGVAAAVAFCAGASLLLVYNLQHDWATLAFISGHSTGLGRATVLARAFLWAGPVLIGFLPPSTDRAYFLRFILDHYVLYGASLCILCLLLFRGFSLWRAAARRVRAPFSAGAGGDIALATLALVVLAGYLATGWGGQQWSGSEPRYLLPLYSALPLAVRLAIPAHPRVWQWAVAWVVVLAVAGAGLSVNTTSFARTDYVPLARLLESRGIRAVYGDYWTVYPLMFASEERVIGVAVDDDLARGVLNNRYSPYLRTAAATSSFAWIAAAGSTRERSAMLCLESLKSRYTRLTWQDQVIILRPTNRAFPWWNGGRCPTVS